jgi:hypothetical protein
VSNAHHVSEGTVRNDCAESAQKLRTRDENEAAIKTANANLKLIKSDPAAGRYGTIVIDPPAIIGRHRLDRELHQLILRHSRVVESNLIKRRMVAA